MSAGRSPSYRIVHLEREGDLDERIKASTFPSCVDNRALHAEVLSKAHLDNVVRKVVSSELTHDVFRADTQAFLLANCLFNDLTRGLRARRTFPPGEIGDVKPIAEDTEYQPPQLATPLDARTNLWPGASSDGTTDSAYASAISSFPWLGKAQTDLSAPNLHDPAAYGITLTPEKKKDDQRDPEVITTSDLGSGYVVAFTAAGRWLEYGIDMQFAGTYDIEFRLASEEQASGAFHLQVDGAPVAGPITVDAASWSQWRSVTKAGVSLTSGPHVVRVSFDSRTAASAPADFTYFRLVRSDFIGAAIPEPEPPKRLAAVAVSWSQIDLTWTCTSEDVTGFKIERAYLGDTYSTLATVPADARSYSDTELRANTKYYYRVRATGPRGDTAASKHARTTTPPRFRPTPKPPPAEEPAPTSAPTAEPPLELIEPPPEAPPAPPAEPIEQNVEPPAMEVAPEVAPPAAPPEEQSDGALPSGWLAADVGLGATSGNATHANGAFVVAGAGAGIWGKSDGFHYVYRALDGDGTIIARVAALQRSNLLAKSGLMIRQTLDANSRHASLLLTPVAGVRFIRRLETAGTTTNAMKTENQKLNPPQWLSLSRRGNTLTAYRSADGANWTLVGSETIELPSRIYVGLAVTSHIAGHTTMSTFDSVTVEA